MSSTPRWLFAIVALSATVAAFGVAYGMRYQHVGERVVLDTWSRTLCSTTGCVRIPDTVLSEAEYAHRVMDRPLSDSVPR